MKSVTGYWFAPKDKKLTNGDGRRIRVGITHKVKGEIIPCHHGLHLSKRPFDALSYAPGPIIYKVKGTGIIIPHRGSLLLADPVDKYVCSERTYTAGGYDCTELLRRFSRMCALDVIHLWDAPYIVKQYLKTGDNRLRVAARAAAKAAARDAARAAASAATRAAASADVWDAVWAAASAATRDAYIKKANRRLTSMLAQHLKT